jgi:hypothetical protein
MRLTFSQTGLNVTTTTEHVGAVCEEDACPSEAGEARERPLNHKSPRCFCAASAATSRV